MATNSITYRVTSSPSSLPQNAMVDTLIDAVKGTWKNELTQYLYLLHEADVI